METLLGQISAVACLQHWQKEGKRVNVAALCIHSLCTPPLYIPFVLT